MMYTYQHNDREYSVNVEALAGGAFRVTVDGERTYHVDAAAVAEGGLLLTLTQPDDLDGPVQRTVTHSSRDKTLRHVHVDGQHYRLTVPDPRAARRRGAAAAGDLTAQMPGQVVEVLVSADDPVSAGQTLVILEAMKMEIRVSAPADGVVKRVLVSAGDVVERGQHLIELGPSSSE